MAINIWNFDMNASCTTFSLGEIQVMAINIYEISFFVLNKYEKMTCRHIQYPRGVKKVKTNNNTIIHN